MKFKEHPPKELFYDNACQCAEYGLNREPTFWREVRTWHDLFHSFGHKCGKVFRSTRVEGLRAGINTEICEQFNSFLQCVKYSAAKMTQEHFMLYMQFLVYMWNTKKTQNVQEMFQVAIGGNK